MGGTGRQIHTSLASWQRVAGAMQAELHRAAQYGMQRFWRIFGCRRGFACSQRCFAAALGKPAVPCAENLASENFQNPTQPSARRVPEGYTVLSQSEPAYEESPIIQLMPYSATATATAAPIW